MLTSDHDQIAEEFTRNGFVVFPDFLSQRELDEINRELHAHYKDVGIDSNAPAFRNRRANLSKYECDVISWNPVGEGNQVFIDLMNHPRLIEVTEDCIGMGFQATASLVMLSIIQGKGQAWHQDCPCKDPSKFNLNRLFYTEDVTEENGAVVVVPGSHKRGLIPEGGHQESMEGELALTPGAGTLVLLSGLCYHRVTPNRTQRPRISVNFRAYSKDTPPAICGVGVYRNGAYDFRRGQPVEL